MQIHGKMTALIVAGSAVASMLFGIGILVGRASKESVVHHQVDLFGGGIPAAPDMKLENTRSSIRKIEFALSIHESQLKQYPTTSEGLASLGNDKWIATLKAHGVDEIGRAHV